MSTAPANRLLEQTILVTGASGFIGSHLCRSLLRQGAELVAVSRVQRASHSERMRWYQADLSDAQAARRLFRDVRPGLILHLCSLAFGDRELSMVLPTFQSELAAAVNVLVAATETGFQRLVLAGSSGEPEPGEIACSPYAAAKAGSRHYARLFHQLYDAPVVLTRIFMAYGPGQSSKKLIPHCIHCFTHGTPVKISWPQLPVDWIYVQDVVDGLLTVARTPGLEGRSLDLGSGQTANIIDVVHLIRTLTHSRSPVEVGGGPDRRYEPGRSADLAATEACTGWHPATSLDSGLEKTVRSFINSPQQTALDSQ